MRQPKPMLTDEQWSKIEPLLPKQERRFKRGRPPIGNKAVLEGILWISRTEERWRDVPEPLPSGSTWRRRLLLWEEQDLWLDIWRAFLAERDERQILDRNEAFIDGSFAEAITGPWSRKDQERQGDKVDGVGRRSRYSTWKPYRLCHAS